MSKFLNKGLVDFAAYVPGEQPRDMQYIKLNTNESPFPPAPSVARVLTNEEIKKLRLYSDPDCRELREAISCQYSVPPANIMMGNGSDEILAFIFLAFCDKNTGVSYPDITYGFYSVLSDLCGIAKRVCPLQEDFTISPNDYINCGSTVIIANPNAPTGIYLSLESVEKIVSGNKNNVVVIDEAYIDFGGKSALGLINKYDNLLVVHTFSKSRGLAGARLGYVFGSEELIADLNKVRYSINPYNVNKLSQLAGLAAIEEQSYYDNNSELIIQTRELLSAELKILGFEFTNSKANFVFAKHHGVGGRELYLALKEKGILVRHFDLPRISDFVRITIGTADETGKLIIALKEIVKNA